MNYIEHIGVLPTCHLVEKPWAGHVVIIFFNGATDHTQGDRGVQPKKYNRLYLRVEKELDAHIW